MARLTSHVVVRFRRKRVVELSPWGPRSLASLKATNDSAFIMVKHEVDDFPWNPMFIHEDGDLPWDPVWAYVLGEDDEGRDQGADKILRLEDDRREESRDTSDGSGNCMIFWQRRRDSSSSSLALTREKWQWELDTSQFLLDTGRKEFCKQQDKAGMIRNWSKCRDKVLQHKKPGDFLGIGVIWKDRSRNNKSCYSLLKS